MAGTGTMTGGPAAGGAARMRGTKGDSDRPIGSAALGAASIPDPIEFRMLLYRAAHAQRQLLHPFMASVGLGTGQPKLLSYLAERGAAAQCELASYFELDPAGVSRMLDALERRGFVSISQGAGDRRSKVVEATPEGVRVARAWNAACREEVEAMLGGFDDAERAAFAGYLRRAHANLRAYAGSLSDAREGEARG